MKRAKLVTDAMKATRKLERPPEITPRAWRGVQALLIALCSFLPDPFPSESKLVARSGYGTRSIERYVALARAAGLITIGKRRTKGPWAHNVYCLNYLVEAGLVNPPNWREATRQTGGLTTYVSLRDTPVSASPSVEEEPSSTACPSPLEGPSRTTTAAFERAPLRRDVGLELTDQEYEALPWWIFRSKIRSGEEWPVNFEGERLNLYPGKCAWCARTVPRLMGWLLDGKPVHDPASPCSMPGSIANVHCQMFEGWRGERRRPGTVGDIGQPRHLRAVQ